MSKSSVNFLSNKPLDGPIIWRAYTGIGSGGGETVHVCVGVEVGGYKWEEKLSCTKPQYTYDINSITCSVRRSYRKSITTKGNKVKRDYYMYYIVSNSVLQGLLWPVLCL